MIADVLYPVAATVTAASALTTAGFAWGTWRAVRRHERALYGADGIEEWDGLVPTVSEHREALKEEDAL